jgi:hypothetical protein
MEHIDRMSFHMIPKNVISTKMKRKFWKTSEMMEEFCFLMSGKDDDAYQWRWWG